MVDITNALQGGTNTIKVEVTNANVNRMIGDEQLSSDITYRKRLRPVKSFSEWLKDPEKRTSGREIFVTSQLIKPEDKL